MLYLLKIGVDDKATISLDIFTSSNYLIRLEELTAKGLIGISPNLIK